MRKHVGVSCYWLARLGFRLKDRMLSGRTTG